MRIIKPEEKQFDDKIDSVFEQNMKSIQNTLNNKFDEKYNEEMLQASLNMINSLIPIAERSYRRYKIDKAAYTLSTLLNQQRECTNDLRSLQSFNDKSNTIKSFVSEATTLILENMLDSVSVLRDILIAKIGIETDNVKKQILEDLLKNFLQDHGKYIVETSKVIEARIDGFITKTPTIPKQRKYIK